MMTSIVPRSTEIQREAEGEVGCQNYAVEVAEAGYIWNEIKTLVMNRSE